MQSYRPVNRRAKFLDRVFRLTILIIFGQTLYFKFSGSAESVYIFTIMGMEPWGRIGTGVAESIASFLLIFPGSVLTGTILALGVISGAIIGHLTLLGIVVMNDGGLLFLLAVIVFVSSLYLLAVRLIHGLSWK